MKVNGKCGMIVKVKRTGAEAGTTAFPVFPAEGETLDTLDTGLSHARKWNSMFYSWISYIN